MAEWVKKFPEEEGIPSLLLVNMMNRWEKELCHVDGYLILRNGNLVAEAYRNPYTRDGRRLLHSVSKTVTAVAVGMAVDEGMISVKDKVLSFFPDYRPQPQSAAFLEELTVEHLLTMAVGHANDSIDSIFSKDAPAWKSFLDRNISDRPGTKFVYNSGATYMLSKIMTVVTGKTLLEYLKPRLFDPLEITDADWDEIDGANAGGWGCFLSLQEMAKIGQLLLQNGKWNGKQLVSEKWISEMTSWKIDTEEANVYPDWRRGYCYQMWRCSREGCFRADGAFGQYILVLPPKNMVVAIWSEDAFSQDMLNIFWEEVYDRVDDRVYGIDGNAHEIYRKKCIEWSMMPKMLPSYSYQEKLVNGKKYEAFSQEESIADSMSFSFSDFGQMRICLEKDGTVSEILADNTGLHYGEGKMNFEIASFIRFGKKRTENMKYAASYQWISDHALKICVNWLETAHATNINCVFGPGSVSAVFSVSYGKYLIGTESSPALLISDQWFSGKMHQENEKENIGQKPGNDFQAYPGMMVRGCE